MTNWHVTPEERTYLRALAAKQAEYAALPIMAARKQMWYDLNDARPGARPPVIVETETFDRDFLPESVFRCTTSAGRRLERQLLRNLRNHELIDDDRVMPDTFDIGWFVEIDPFGVEIPTETLPDHDGINTGYRYLHPIKNLKEDLPKLKPAACRVDREATREYQAFAEDLLDGILPVALRSGAYGTAMLTNRVIALMGMEAFFVAMYDSPEELHQLLAYLRDNCLRVQRWAEAEGLLCLNNANQESFGSSYNFTTQLPAPGADGKVRLCDMWGCANSQETVGVSPEMFHEFCFPYYRDAVAPLGLLYYGCCEPVHPYWEDLSKLPHLKKVSISRWCDQDFVGEALQGTGLVFSRKPDPNFFAVDVELREEAWAEHIRESLLASHGAFMEIIVRDVYTVHGNLNKPRRAVEIARTEIDRHLG